MSWSGRSVGQGGIGLRKVLAWWGIGVLVVFVALAILVGIQSPPQKQVSTYIPSASDAAPPTLDPAAVETADEVTSGLNFLYAQWRPESGLFGHYIDGAVSADRRFETVSVEINLYDASGALVGNTGTSIENLSPPDVWKFEAYTTNTKAVTFKVARVSGY
jgi:hypothetical protein